MNLFTYNTMRLTEWPAEIASATRKAWDALFDIYGWDAFHPIEGRGVIRHALGLRLPEAQALLENIVDRGFATAP